MKMKELYLSSTDTIDFEIPRRITELRHLVIDERPVLEVRLDRPVCIFDQEPSEIVTDRLYLTNRHVGGEEKIERLDTFPIEVYVLTPKHSTADPTQLDDLRNIAWATLYDAT